MKYITGLYFWPLIVIATVFLYSWIELDYQIRSIRGKTDGGRKAHKIATIWGKLAFKIVPSWSIEVTGKENIPDDSEATVMIANHESMSDIWAMYFLDTQFRWLAKAEVFKTPFVGRAMKLVGYVPVRRGEKSSHMHAMTEAEAILRGGIPMFFFPEGTRSKDGKIKDFKNGAFKLAQTSQCRILPIAIHGAGNLMPKGSLIPGPSSVKVKILPPLDPPAADQKSLEEYVAKARDQIIEAHASLVN